LMLKMKVEEICKENGIQASVESSDFNAGMTQQCDLIVTVKELASQFESNQKVANISTYINKKKIQEDVLNILKELSN
ncbi:PTS maltose transporter subunit IIBC, partial [Staphylococcus sp. SIMBA_130]